MERLKSTMESRGVTGYRLSKDCGINNSTIRNWLSGRADIPRPKHLQKIADYLQVHPAWLLYGDKQYTPSAENELSYIFKEASEFVSEHPEALSYIKNIIKGVIKGGDFQKNNSVILQKAKANKRQKTA